MVIFEDVLQPIENADNSDLQQDRYRFIVKNWAQFDLVVDYVSVGALFGMASQIVQMTKDRTGLASIGCASEGKVTSYIQIVLSIFRSFPNCSLQLGLSLWPWKNPHTFLRHI